ncbi:MAG: glycosyltransferase [Clostridia bacterium]|nr:glycosyltransferase [Clostridia bacterium]
MSREKQNPLLASGNIRRASFVWNLLSAAMNSFQTMLLLVFITRFGTDTDSASFVMAYAAGNLLYNIGKYGVRQFQVTDSAGQYSFRDYAAARWVSLACMAVAVAAYVLSGVFFRGYTATKALVVLLICLYKGIEAAEDVFHGRMQQQGRLDVAGRILFIRIFSFVVCFAAVFVFTRNILLTAAAATCLAAVLAVVLNRSVWGTFAEEKTAGSRVKQLLRACAPLCLSMLLNMYLGNAPKYIIDGRVTDAVQTQFNIVYMPVFVLVLLGTFIYQPELKSLGEMRREKQFDGLKRKALRLTGITLGLTVAAAAGGWLLGIPVLEFIYKTPLDSLRTELLLFILCGGMIALTNLYGMILIAFRRQGTLTGVYVLSALVLFLFGRPVLSAGGVRGLTIFFTEVLAAHTLALALCSFCALKQAGQKYDRICINGYFTSEPINGVPRYCAEIIRRLDAMLPECVAELVVPEGAEHIPELQHIHVTTREERGNKKEMKGPLWGTVVYGPYVRKKKALNVNLSNRAEWVNGSLTCLHDVISLRNDAYDLPLPEDYLKKVQKKWKINRWWFLFKIFVKRHTAGTVVTVSEASAEALEAQAGIEKERIKVIGGGWEHVRAQEEADEQADPRLTGGNYYFFIGNLYPHKNLKWIMDEAKANPNSVFAVAGKMPFDIAEDLGLNLPNMLFLGYISDAYMKWLMAHAKALLFPSRAEGFGIPPLEALSLGTPAIVSDIPVLREIYGNTVHYIDPDDGTADLDALLKEPTEDAAGVLEQYSWDRSAEKWFELIRGNLAEGTV